MLRDRLTRESHTIEQMIKIYCNAKHKSTNSLCSECILLLEYSIDRIQNCKFGLSKPICKKCSTHCYKKDMRERIKQIMRYSGPRMLFLHPILTIMHLMDAMNNKKIYKFE